MKPGIVAPSRLLTCNQSASTADFTAQVSAATVRQVICLASGNYGTFSGTNKAITLTAASGASVRMGIDFGSGDTGFTIDGSGAGGNMSISGGYIENSANHITVKNAAFTSQTVISVSGGNSAIVLDHDTFNNQNTIDCKQWPGRIVIINTTTPSDVTVSNSVFSGGDLDGIDPNSPKGSITIGNQFIKISSGPDDCQHTDALQMYGGANNIIRNNYFADVSDAIVAFDGTSGNIISGNTCIRIGRGDCIDLYADLGSVVEHNTGAAGMPVLELNHKPTHKPGSGTIFRNNIGSVTGDDVSTLAVNTKNLFAGATSPNINGTPIFVGGASPTTWDGFKLAPGSPGIGASTDGTNVGIN